MLSRLTYITFTLLLFAGVIAINPQTVNAATYEEQTVSLINTQRQQKNLAPYKSSDALSQAAAAHNNTMVSCAKQYGMSSCFKHQVTLLSEPKLMDRVKATGYKPRAVAENIAWGYTSPSGVINGWMGSSGHRANILGNYKDVGCDFVDSQSGSYKGMYWTCVFGTSFSTSTSVTPTPTKTSPALTPTPTRATPTPTKIATNATPTPTPVVPTSTTSTTSTDKPWWCVYVPNYSLCK